MWSRRTHAWRVAALTIIGTAIVLPLVVFVLGPNMPPGTSVADGAKSQVEDNTVLLVVMTPFTVFILVYLGYALTAFRAEPGEGLRDGAPIRGHFRAQLAWLVSTTAAVLFLAIFGTTELLADNGAGGGSGPNPVTKPGGPVLPVQVIGQQWEFTYRYPTYGGVETASLVLPVHRTIAFHVTSLDVIHSFWAYELGVKADANPGVDNVAYVRLEKQASFHIRCAELCGLWHGYMDDTGRIVDDSTFAKWIAARQTEFRPVSKYLPGYAPSYSPDPTFRAG